MMILDLISDHCSAPLCVKEMEGQDNWFQSNIGAVYKPRRVFVFSVIDQFQLFKPWKPGKWNSFCVVHQRNYYSLNLNSQHILSQVYKDNNDSTFLSYDVMLGPFFGAIADLQIWRKSFTDQEITGYNECKRNSGGDFYQWEPSDFTLSDMAIEELAGEEYCPKPPKTAIIASGKLSQFYESIQFCHNVFRGRMAVGKDLDCLRDMTRAVSDSSCSVKSYFFTGHINQGNGRFLDFYDKQPVNFRIVEINLNVKKMKKENLFFF